MIAFDAGSNGTVTGTTLTVSHTVGGSSRLLVVGIIAGNADVVTGVTFNGVAMTRIDVQNNGNSTAYLYYLLSPATGAHDIVVSTSGSVSIFLEGASFTGVKQTTPDASVKNTANAAASCANTLTTVADNAVHIATFAVDANPVTSITNGTSVNVFMGYSAIIHPAAPHTLTGNSSGGNNAWATVGASFAPFLGGGSETEYSFFM